MGVNGIGRDVDFLHFMKLQTFGEALPHSPTSCQCGEWKVSQNLRCPTGAMDLTYIHISSSQGLA